MSPIALDRRNPGRTHIEQRSDGALTLCQGDQTVALDPGEVRRLIDVITGNSPSYRTTTPAKRWRECVILRAQTPTPVAEGTSAS